MRQIVHQIQRESRLSDRWARCDHVHRLFNEAHFFLKPAEPAEAQLRGAPGDQIADVLGAEHRGRAVAYELRADAVHLLQRFIKAQFSIAHALHDLIGLSDLVDLLQVIDVGIEAG